MKDFLGQDLSIGDTVVFVVPSYRKLSKGKVVKFTKCFVVLADYDTKIWSLGDTFRQEPQQVVKITELTKL